MTSRSRTKSKNGETTLCMSTLKFTTLSNVELTLSISVLILTTLDNVETMLLFSTSSFTTLINVKTTLWIWPVAKRWKEQKCIFWKKRRKKLSTPTSKFRLLFQNLVGLLPALREIWRRIFAKPQKFLWRKCCITRTIFKRSPLVKILSKFKHVMIDAVLILRLLCLFGYIITSHEAITVLFRLR